MVQRIALVGALILFWLTLSGHFDSSLLLGLGAASVLVTYFLTARMGILDIEASPYAMIPRLLPYLGWLSGEIVKANLAVVKAVLRSDLEVTPKLVKIPAVPESNLGKAIFANSITLTPGTVSVDLEDNEILVHALIREFADPKALTGMGERVRRSVDRRSR